MSTVSGNASVTLPGETFSAKSYGNDGGKWMANSDSKSNPVRLTDLITALSDHVESLRESDPASDRLRVDLFRLARLQAFSAPILAVNPTATVHLSDLASLLEHSAVFRSATHAVSPFVSSAIGGSGVGSQTYSASIPHSSERPVTEDAGDAAHFGSRTRTEPVLKSSISARSIGADVKRRSRGSSGSLPSGFALASSEHGSPTRSNVGKSFPWVPSPPLTPDVEGQPRLQFPFPRLANGESSYVQPNSPLKAPLFATACNAMPPASSAFLLPEVNTEELEKLRACMLDVTKRLYDTEKRLSVSQEQSESRIAALQERIKIWQSDVASSKRQLADLRAVERAQLSQIEMMESSAWKLAKELEEKRAECQSLRAVLDEKESYEVKLMADLKRKEDESAAKESSLKLLESEIRKYMAENARLEARITVLKSQLDSSESQMSRLVAVSSQVYTPQDVNAVEFSSLESITAWTSSLAIPMEPIASPHCIASVRVDVLPEFTASANDSLVIQDFGSERALSPKTVGSGSRSHSPARNNSPNRLSPTDRGFKDLDSILEVFHQEIKVAKDSALKAQSELAARSLKEQELSDMITSLQNELSWYREQESTVETVAKPNEYHSKSSFEDYPFSEKRQFHVRLPRKSTLDTVLPSTTPVPVPKPKTNILSLFAFPSALIRLPRWAIPLFLYSVLMWNSGAVFGPISFPEMFFSFFAGSSSSSTSAPTIGNQARSDFVATASSLGCDSGGIAIWVQRACES
ncbi:hypothetical protein DFJ73DRAFT_836510 [Zopfochytrium polystomum]|nr:hypothetical protein DFJ73DRAFT_836510 [Zopfochytrium polystomum]